MKKIKAMPKNIEAHNIFCVRCMEMQDLVVGDVYKVDDDNVAWQCKPCGSVYFMEPDTIPVGECEAYERAIKYVMLQNNVASGQINEIRNEVEMVKQINTRNQALVRRANTNLFVLEKSAKDIQKFIKKKKYDEATKEAVDLEIFITEHNKKLEMQNEKI